MRTHSRKICNNLVRTESVCGIWPTPSHPSPAHKLEIPLQTGTGQDHRTLSPLTPSWRAAFLILPPGTCCWGYVLGKHDWEVRVPFPHPDPTPEMEALPGHSAAENLGFWAPMPQLIDGSSMLQAKKTWAAVLPLHKRSATNSGVPLWEK